MGGAEVAEYVYSSKEVRLQKGSFVGVSLRARRAFSGDNHLSSHSVVRPVQMTSQFASGVGACRPMGSHVVAWILSRSWSAPRGVRSRGSSGRAFASRTRFPPAEVSHVLRVEHV